MLSRYNGITKRLPYMSDALRCVLEGREKAMMRDEIARKFLKFKHPSGIEWGHTGTIDDESWRRLEDKCLDAADEILSLIREKVEGVPTKYPSGYVMTIYDYRQAILKELGHGTNKR